MNIPTVLLLVVAALSTLLFGLLYRGSGRRLYLLFGAVVLVTCGLTWLLMTLLTRGGPAG